MNVLVEFAGMSRVITHEKQLVLMLEAGTTFRDVVRMLGVRYPDLIGQVISPEGDTLYASNMLNLDGKLMVRSEQMDDVLDDGARLTIMSVLAGG
ncbi:MAG: MoaD/ThiS family protein [Anaerolineae bacterium]|nr:MoaD/ThiS family protein [Anaerolineae bacterium]